MFVGIYLLRQPGADFSHYADWARAFRHGDIMALNEDGLWSPLGVPLSQWQFGTGLVYALPSFLAWTDLLAVPAILSCVGLLFFFLTLRRLTRDPIVAMLFFSLAWVATPLGFYSFSQSSETLAATFLAIYYYLLTSDHRRSFGFYLLCGIAGGWVVSTRMQLGIWVVAGVPVLLAELLRRRQSEPTSGARVLASLGLFSVPIVAGVAANQLVNRWMTGSAFLSPYVFGDEGFKSVDLLRPHLLAVLLHPWHGLLTYHPVFVVPIVLLGACLIPLYRGGFRAGPWLAPAVLVAFCLQLWVQSAWYCWWLGTATFGMRAFAPAVVPLFIAATPLYEKAVQKSPVPGLLSRGLPGMVSAGFILLATAWSSLLLTQDVTNFTSVGFLIGGQVFGLWALLSSPVTYLAGTLAIGLVWLSLGGQAGSTGSRGLALARFATTAVLFVLLRGVLLQGGAISLAILLASAAVLTPVLKYFAAPTQPQPWKKLAQVAGLLFAGVWFFAQIVFVRLAIQTEGQLRPNPEGQTFHIQEVTDTYREYLDVAGFEDEKRALADFIARAAGHPGS